MFDNYRNRMTYKGRYMGETMRKESDSVVDATWLNSVAARRVQVTWLNHGLPQEYISSEDFEDPIDAHFELKSSYNINSGESPYYLTFRPGELARRPEIKIGAYVSIPNVDDIPEWWMIVFIEDDNELNKLYIMKCNWIFKWVADGKIYSHLGVLRNGSSIREADENAYTTMVNGNSLMWMATNADTQTIKHGQRLLISDKGRIPPLCYSVSNITDTHPVGLTKFVLSQNTFDAVHDNAELMLANYYDSEILPEEVVEIEKPVTVFDITYNGIKPTVKVGGSAKVFTAQLPDDNRFDIKWSLSDGVNTYNSSYDNSTEVLGDYTIITGDRTMKVAVANNYNLIGTILTISAECADGSTGSVQVEVI